MSIRRFQQIVKGQVDEAYGVQGDTVDPSRYGLLYHLTNAHGFAYSIKQRTLSSRGSSLSVTWDETMNHIIGKSHLAFKLVLNGHSAVAEYGAHEFDDRGYVGDELVSHGEREVRLETQHLDLTKHLIGTCVMCDLYTEGGLQDMLYKNRGRENGFMTPALGDAGPAIYMVIHHLENDIPLWKQKVGTQFSSEDYAFLYFLKNIADQNMDFMDALVAISERAPIKDHRGIVRGDDVYQRRLLTPFFNNALNSYYADRRYDDVDETEIKKLIQGMVNQLDLGSNLEASVLCSLEQNQLFNKYTPAVHWASLLSLLIDGDIDEFEKTAAYLGSQVQKSFGHDTTYSYHVGTQFGRSRGR